MTKPNTLFKYESINEYSLRNLKNASLFFNAPSSFNDPFDCSILLDSLTYNDNDVVKLFNHYVKSGKPVGSSTVDSIDQVPKDFIIKSKSGLIKAIEGQQERHLNSIGCTCFSEINNHLLMWSHYANGHRGICLEFDTSCDLFDRVFKVTYSHDYPKLNPIELILNNRNLEFDNYALQPLLTKYKCWEYEKEWRAFHQESRKLYTYPVDALKAVYFGIDVNKTDIEIICLILQGQNENTKFFKCEKSKKDYEISFSEFTYTPYKDTI